MKGAQKIEQFRAQIRTQLYFLPEVLFPEIFNSLGSLGILLSNDEIWAHLFDIEQETYINIV